MNFEAYLSSKKIDSVAFKKAEPVLWDLWRKEFEQVHPNSFTAQKLYLINPIRRKYQQAIEALPEIIKSAQVNLPSAEPKIIPAEIENTGTEVAKPKPAVARPVVKPKLPSAISQAESQAAPTPASIESSAVPAKPIAAKPVMARPVIKPKPTVDDSINPDGQSPNIPSDATAVKQEEAPSVVKPTSAKPVMARPVIKPKQPATEPAKSVEQSSESIAIPDNTKITDIEQNETPPAKASKPAIPRPVIKPPKPKID